MPGKKSTKAEIINRVNTVYDMLVVGSSRGQIQQYVATKTDWGVNKRSIDEYIARANDRLAQESQIHRAAELGKALSRLNMLYQKTLQVQDFQRCLSVQRELNQLLGLYEPTKVEVNINLEVVNRAWSALEAAGKNPEAVLTRLAEQAERVH